MCRRVKNPESCCSVCRPDPREAGGVGNMYGHLEERTFVFGSFSDPENLKTAMGMHFEAIGQPWPRIAQRTDTPPGNTIS